MESSASMIQEVMDMFPVTTAVNQGENANKEIEIRVSQLNNMLLTKESEIAALKEVLSKWKQRALDAESNAYYYYLDQLESIQLQHEVEMKSLESRYTRKLNEQEDVINSLKEQVDFLIVQNTSHRMISQQSQEEYYNDRDTDSFISTCDDDDDDQSVVSSIYDRVAEQRLSNNPSPELATEQETILCNIQSTMRAIESELNAHPVQGQKRFRHRRSPTFHSDSTTYSSSTLIDSSENKKIKKKSSFFINRIFKKLYNNSKNSFYTTRSLCSSSWSSSPYEEDAYSTSTTVRNDSIPNILDRNIYTTVI